jgi:hypothetical protein
VSVNHLPKREALLRLAEMIPDEMVTDVEQRMRTLAAQTGQAIRFREDVTVRFALLATAEYLQHLYPTIDPNRRLDDQHYWATRYVGYLLTGGTPH